MERKYNMEIERLLVEITYDFTEGDSGDYWTPPTGDRVDVLSWRLIHEDEDRDLNADLEDDEWEEWMRDIDHYVYNDSMWDILEWEESLRYIDFDEN